MNVSATLSALKLLVRPSLCIPHATVSTFDQLPIPISEALAAANGGKRPDIRALVLDKDNCFAKPRENFIHKPYVVSAPSKLHIEPGFLYILTWKNVHPL